MKVLLFSALVFACSLGLCQESSLLRTDGIYIFDNGIDSIAMTDNFAKGLKAQYMYVAPGQVFDNRPCGSGDAVPIDITANPFLNFIVFFSDSSGRIKTIGACRDEQNIRNKVLSYLVQKSTGTQPNYSSNHFLDNLQLLQDSCISFNDSSRMTFNEKFKGRAYGESLDVEMQRSVAKCDQIYIERRKYVFYSYSQIFNCDWVYLKPNSRKKD